MIRNTITFGVSPAPRGSRLSNLHTVIPESSRRTRPRGHAEPTVHCPGSRHRHGPRCRRGNSAAFEKQHQRGGRCELSSVLKQSGPWGPTLSREASISKRSRVGLLGSSSAGLVAEELPYYYHHRGCGARQPKAQPVTASSAGRSPRGTLRPRGGWPRTLLGSVTALPSATPDPKLSSPSARSSLAGWRWLRLRGKAPGASEHLPGVRGGDGAVVQAHHSFHKEASRLRPPKGLQVLPSIGNSHLLQTIFTLFSKIQH